MAKMTKNTTSGKYELNLTPTENEQTNTLAVSGKYCDTDIDIKVSAIPSSYVIPSGDVTITQQTGGNVSGYATATVRQASSFSLAITDKASTNITVGTLSSGYYPLTTSLEGTFSASTNGWFASGTATDSTVTVGRIAAAGYSAATSTYTNKLTITPSTSEQYVKITAGYTPNAKITINAMSNGSLSNTASSGVTYTENEDDGTVIPANGYLYINAGYFPNTKISLSHLIPDPETGKTNVGAAQMRTGYVAFDGSGNKIVGTMADVTPTFTGGTPSLTSKTNTITLGGMSALGSGTSSYYIDAQASAKATRTAVTYSAAATGYINKASGTSASAAATEADAETIDATRVYIPAAVGSVDVTTTLTRQPAISRQTFTIANVTDASNGAAVTTAPTSGVYVKVSAAANTTTTTAKSKITTAGYTPTNNSFASATITYGSSVSADTYIPVKTGSVTMPSTLSGSSASKSIDAANGTITLSKSLTNQASSITAGWISAKPSGTTSVSLTASIDIYDGSYTEATV